ncbi:MAG: hypothetical protein DMD33_02830 [Gemmatimonadetes bacterium]|nr:MAG: hypothetical protein DMD33_02830 [Gemmatimonadota bacterium]
MTTRDLAWSRRSQRVRLCRRLAAHVLEVTTGARPEAERHHRTCGERFHDSEHGFPVVKLWC